MACLQGVLAPNYELYKEERTKASYSVPIGSEVILNIGCRGPLLMPYASCNMLCRFMSSLIAISTSCIEDDGDNVALQTFQQ